MKKSSFVKGLFAMSLVAASMWGLAGCTSSNPDEVKLTGGVAATVNGVEIQEDTITKAIESTRKQADLTDQDKWGQQLATYGYTPESYRKLVIDSYVDQEVLRQKAGDLDVTADDATIDSYVEQMKANYESDEAWNDALSKVGWTEEDYRHTVETSILEKGVTEALNKDEEPSQDSVLNYAKLYISTFDGAKRSSHILFDSADQETAQSVLDQLNAGTLDFAKAATDYSKDSGSAAKGGDVGWDKQNTFVSEYQTALNDLSAGQMSGLVTSQYGIHIIKCTEEFKAPEEVTSLDQLPAEYVANMTSMVKSQEKTKAFEDWLDQMREECDIVVNDMPADVPYNVDMSKYATSSSSAATSADSAAATDSSDSGDEGNAGESDAGESNEASTPDESSSDEGESDNASEKSAEGSSSSSAAAAA